MRWGLLAILWMIAACATNEQVCASHGYKPGDDYANCMMRRQQAQQDELDRVRSFQSGMNVWRGSIHPPICAGRTCY
ncbi:MAG TPA: hypothetical protein VD978_04465 [Azospirillum sp.]|nr:hypothetical protein [Azospirillum sp.]